MSVVLVALPLTGYVPLPALVGEVTCKLVDAFPPGEIVSDGIPSADVHPLGTESPKVNVEELQLALSLFLTPRTYSADAPGCAVCVTGENVTVGLACVQGVVFRLYVPVVEEVKELAAAFVAVAVKV